VAAAAGLNRALGADAVHTLSGDHWRRPTQSGIRLFQTRFLIPIIQDWTARPVRWIAEMQLPLVDDAWVDAMRCKGVIGDHTFPWRYSRP